MSQTHPSISPPPRQVRSRRTLERILAATERLLARERFESITVRKIVRQSRTSIGSFYARFNDKRALLPALYERYELSLAARLHELERSLAAPGQTLTSVATLIVEHLIRLYGERPHLMRALAEYARRDPGALDEVTRMRRRAQHNFMCGALVTAAGQRRSPKSERVAATALFVIDAACRERLLHPEATHAEAVDLTEEELTEALIRTLVAFLTTTAAP